MPQGSPHRPEFRADIQGLRAIAVAAVVGYHLWPGAVRGGYVGVDVFFVISGFLITGQLTAELDRTGRVSLTRFWARRVRRLLPAAFTVLAVCTWFLVDRMPSLVRRENLAEIRASAAYVENWLLGRHAVDYLARENSPSLVQHYWSLSVEEQYYLIWPLLLVAALAAARLTGLNRRAVFGGALALVAAGSLAVSVIWTARQPAMAFFASPTRAWEFAAGGLVALHRPARHAGRSSAALAAGWIGLVLVLGSVLTLRSAGHFPGWIAAVPVSGAALLVAGPARTSRWSALSWSRLRPVQWLGDASYSVYLWHWPLIIGLPWALHHDLTAGDRWAIVAATLLLAAVTKVLVEDPIRRSHALRRRRWPSYGLAAAGVAAFATVGAVWAPTFTAPRPPVAAGPLSVPVAGSVDVSSAAGSSVQGALQGRSVRARPVRSCFGAAAMMPQNRCAHPFRRPKGLDTAFAAQDHRHHHCLQDMQATTAKLCVLETPPHVTKTIAVVGNSHAWRLAPALAAYGRANGWRILMSARVNCLGLTTRPVGTLSAGDSCLRWSSSLQHLLLTRPNLDAVVFVSHESAAQYLAGSGADAAALQQAQQQMLSTWQALKRRGVAVLVTQDVPGMHPDADPECIAMSTAKNDPCSLPRAGLVHDNLLSSLARHHPELAHYLPLAQYFCDAQRCHALIGGVIVYFDSNHLTDTFALSLAPYLGPQVARAIAG